MSALTPENNPGSDVSEQELKAFIDAVKLIEPFGKATNDEPFVYTVYSHRIGEAVLANVIVDQSAAGLFAEDFTDLDESEKDDFSDDELKDMVSTSYALEVIGEDIDTQGIGSKLMQRYVVFDMTSPQHFVEDKAYTTVDGGETWEEQKTPLREAFDQYFSEGGNGRYDDEVASRFFDLLDKNTELSEMFGEHPYGKNRYLAAMATLEAIHKSLGI